MLFCNRKREKHPWLARESGVRLLRVLNSKSIG